MSVEKVRAYLTPYGVAQRIRELEVSSATVELAAIAVGVEGARIAKSMSFKLADDEPIIIVTAGDMKIDNTKYKAYFHVKAKMLTFDEDHTMIGHDPGGENRRRNGQQGRQYVHQTPTQHVHTVSPSRRGCEPVEYRFRQRGMVFQSRSKTYV